MLKITVHESESAIEVVLEGRVAGPWVSELERAWLDLVPRLGSRGVRIDMRNVTYADGAGRNVLRGIFSQSKAKLVASSLEIRDFAEEVARN